MVKLLSANLYRLWRNWLFWLCLMGMLLLSVGSILNGSRQAALLMQEGYQVALDSYYFSITPIPSFFFAIWTSMFLGTEYSDGTIRNKIIVGHTRTAIYLANLLTALIASFFIVLAWLAGGLAGLFTFEGFQMSASSLLLWLLVCALFSSVLCALFTLVGMLSSSKAATVLISLLLFLGMLIWASMIYNRLCEPETYSGVIMTAEGMQISDPVANPEYLSGLKRTVYEVILNILPTGQAILMANLDLSRPVLQLASSAVLTAGITALGVALFHKKDLK